MAIYLSLRKTIYARRFIRHRWITCNSSNQRWKNDGVTGAYLNLYFSYTWAIDNIPCQKKWIVIRCLSCKRIAQLPDNIIYHLLCTFHYNSWNIAIVDCWFDRRRAGYCSYHPRQRRQTLQISLLHKAYKLKMRIQRLLETKNHSTTTFVKSLLNGFPLWTDF